MIAQTFVNVKSVRKYQKDGSYCAQLITADTDGNHSFYACRLSGSNTLDTNEAYQYVNREWQPVTVDSELGKSLEGALKRLVSVTGNAYKRKHEAADGSISYSMYVDTVLYVSTDGGHAIKIDDKLFYTASPRELLPFGGLMTTIRYTLLSDPSVSATVDLATDANTGACIRTFDWDFVRNMGYSPAKLLAGNEIDQFLDTPYTAALTATKSSLKHIAGGLVVGLMIAAISNATGCTDLVLHQAEKDVATSTIEPRAAHTDMSLAHFQEQNAYANKTLHNMRLYAADGSAK